MRKWRLGSLGVITLIGWLLLGSLPAQGGAADDLRERIARLADDLDRPLWQIDLASLLLGDRLSWMIEFGIIDDQQRDAFASLLREAKGLLDQADRQLFIWQTLLSRQADHTSQRINTGRWHRMMIVYRQVRLGLARAYAIYFQALLLDQAGESDKAAEHLQQAQAAIEAWLLHVPADDMAMTHAGRSLLGRVLLRQGRVPEAVALLQALPTSDPPGPGIFAGRLALVQAAAVSGDCQQVRSRLDMLHTQAHTRGNWQQALLIADLAYRLTIQAGDAGDGPYLRLWRSLPKAPQLADVRLQIGRRCARMMATMSSEKHWPSDLGIAAVQALGHDAQYLLATGGTDAGDSADRHAAAQGKLQQIMRITALMMQQSGVPGRDQVILLTERARAIRLAWPGDAARLRAAAGALYLLAMQQPDPADMLAGLQQAAELLQERSAPGLHDLYAHVTGNLLDRFPRSQAAADHRLGYAQGHLIPAGQLVQAADVLIDVPRSHRDWPTAQVQRLLCLAELQSGDAATANWAQQLIAEAHKLLGQLGDGADMPAVGQERQPVHIAHTRWVLAHSLTAAGRFDDALAQLELLEQDVLLADDLRGRVLATQTAALLATGQIQQAIQHAQQVVRQSPHAIAWHRRIGRAMWQAGHPRLAAEHLEAVIAQAANPSAQLILETAHAWLAAGQVQDITRAAELYRRLIDTAQPDTQGRYPDNYWEAWVKLLGIVQQFSPSVSEVRLRVRQLEQLDPQLGGEPYRSQLRDLLTP